MVFTALLDAGDEVIVPDPAWPNYGMSAMLRGAVPVPYGQRRPTASSPTSKNSAV